MTKEDIIKTLESKVLDQEQYEKQGLYGDMPHGAKTAYESAIRLVKKLTMPIVVKSFVCELCDNTEGVDEISICNNCWDSVNNH